MSPFLYQPGAAGCLSSSSAEGFQLSETVRLEVTSDEALVLFEFLSRYAESDQLSIEDQAEQRALRNLQCLFERQLVEALRPDYESLLAAARDGLRDSTE
jgi:hypothetical protein